MNRQCQAVYYGLIFSVWAHVVSDPRQIQQPGGIRQNLWRARGHLGGAPRLDLSSSNWVWGGTGTIGATWIFDRSWFLDVYYSYSNIPIQT